MGSSQNEIGHRANKSPRHWETIARFFMSNYLVMGWQ